MRNFGRSIGSKGWAAKGSNSRLDVTSALVAAASAAATGVGEMFGMALGFWTCYEQLTWNWR